MLTVRNAVGALIAVLFAVSLVAGTAPSRVEAATLRVPAQFPTIQSAIDAASPGDTVRVSSGTYVEQLTITEDIKLVGSGAGGTIVRAPVVLVPGQAGTNSIVEIRNGASVSISRLTVSGPGSGTCASGALRTGIRVFGGGRLDLKFAAVVDIHDATPMACGRSGNAVSGGTGSINVQYSLIRNYQSSAFVMVGGTATFTHNVVIGQGLNPNVASNGVEIVAGGTGTIAYNVISGNQCGSQTLGCGPDFFSELQVAGIGAGADVVVSRNLLFNNQVGAYVSENTALDHNVILNSDYFGLALQDGDMTSTGDTIIGGGGGVAVVAAFVDTTATLNNLTILGGSGPDVQEFECCGLTTTVIGGP